MKLSKDDRDIIDAIASVSTEDSKAVINILKSIFSVSVLRSLVKDKQLEIPFIGKFYFEVETYERMREIRKRVKVIKFEPSDVFMGEIDNIDKGIDAQAKKWFKDSICRTITGELGLY